MAKFADQTNGCGVMFRGAEFADDVRFLIKSWVRSYANSPWAGAISRQRLVRAIRETIMDLLQREDTQIVIACCEHDRNLIYGFCVFERGYDFPVLHYCYVKAGFRNCGIGADLRDIARGSSDEPLRYSFRTPASRKFLRAANGRYAPDLARRTRKQESS